ncbi:MAG: terminase family protein [Candidatus Bathyarchaeota archaeon]|nr:terminase family protein [Candidatus Bathyarchaeota archaeon]
MRGYLEKEARTLRPSQILPQWHNVQQSNKQVRQTVIDRAKELSADPSVFFKQMLGFTPYEYQQEFIELFKENQFTAARWCRQSGKTYIVSALLLWYAVTHPNSSIGIVGPSWRQTKRILSRIAAFTYNLPSGVAFKPKRTQVNFMNGSSIEAFPNNPETIRGPTLHVVYADEFNFVANDQELYDAILYTLGTTDGKFVCSSTPWHSDSVFFKIFNHKDFSDFKTSHVTMEKALTPKGPLKPNIIQKIKTQMGDDQSRWRREMKAEWAEDDDVWLTQSLIASCIGTAKSCGEDLREFNAEMEYKGEFFAGLDLAQTKDYSVLSVVERRNDRLLLRHLKIFQQPTLYATVLGYTKALQDRWNGFEKIRIDFTREGPSIIADMENAGIDNTEGVNFSVPRKSEMAGLFKQRMMDKRFFYPLLSWERPYRGEICTELNVERYELRRDGAIGFSHPRGTHDDVFWSIALAVYATANMEPEPFLAIIPR